MVENNKEIDLVETELEAQGTGNVIAIKSDSIQDTLWLADNIDKIVAAQKKIFMGIIKIVNAGDFVAFGGGDKKETVEIRGAGCERIARDLGVSFVNWSPERVENLSDEKGGFFRYIYECDAIWRSRVVRVLGIVSSRDKFFGKEQGKYKEVWEVSRDDVQKAAHRQCKKEGVKAIFGLRHLDRKELESFGVRVLTSGGHTFKSKDDKAAETSTNTVAIEDFMIYKTGKKTNGQPWTLYKITTGQGEELFTYSETFYNTAKKAKQEKLLVMVSYQLNSKGGKEITAINVTGESAF